MWTEVKDVILSLWCRNISLKAIVKILRSAQNFRVGYDALHSSRILQFSVKTLRKYLHLRGMRRNRPVSKYSPEQLRPANEPRLLGAQYPFGGSNWDRSEFLLLGRDWAPYCAPRPNRDEQRIHWDETDEHLPKYQFVRFGSVRGSRGIWMCCTQIVSLSMQLASMCAT